MIWRRFDFRWYVELCSGGRPLLYQSNRLKAMQYISKDYQNIEDSEILFQSNRYMGIKLVYNVDRHIIKPIYRQKQPKYKMLSTNKKRQRRIKASTQHLHFGKRSQ